MKYTYLLVIALLVLSACSGENTNKLDNTVPFVGGNAGLNMYLQDGLPPPEVYDGGDGPFSVGVVIENVGEHTIDPANGDYISAVLEGLYPTNFGVTEDDLVFRSPEPPFDSRIQSTVRNFDGTIIPGDIINIIWPKNADALSYQPDLPGNQIMKYRAKICYDYQTIATSVLCMKNSLLENAQDATLCTLNGDKPVMNSGAPIHVTSLRQSPIDSNVIQVTFNIEHVGTGEFYGDSDYTGVDDDCDTSPTNTNKYKVDVKVSTDDGSIISCPRLEGGDEGVITMYQGKPTSISCRIDGSASNARVYQTNMNVVLSYRYGEFIEDQFTILAVPHDS